MTSDKTCVLILDKEIGNRCLWQLLKRDIKFQLITNKLKGEDLIKRIQMRVYKPDIIFCIGLTKMIPKEILAIAPCLNIHPALLPKYRGRYSIPHAIFNGEKYTGATIHWMDEGIDSGAIIMQEKIKIEKDDTAQSIWDKFNDVGEKLFGEFLDLWLSGETIDSYPQDESESTYYPKCLPNSGQIDLSWDKNKIDRFKRAMTYEKFNPCFNSSP